MIVLDANVLIAVLDRTDASHQKAFDLIEEHAWDEFGASVLTIAETLVRPVRDDRGTHVRHALDALGVRSLALEAEDALSLATARATHRLRLPDAVVLHTAERTGSRLATFDRALRAAASEASITLADLPDIDPEWPEAGPADPARE